MLQAKYNYFLRQRIFTKRSASSSKNNEEICSKNVLINISLGDNKKHSFINCKSSAASNVILRENHYSHHVSDFD
jgi:hypothetical protein